MLMAVAGHDFHRKPAFYDVGVEMDVETLCPEAILGRLRRGAYRIRSRFFRAEAQPQFSRAESACLQLISRQLATLRKARDFFLRWST